MWRLKATRTATKTFQTNLLLTIIHPGNKSLHTKISRNIIRTRIPKHKLQCICLHALKGIVTSVTVRFRNPLQPRNELPNGEKAHEWMHEGVKSQDNQMHNWPEKDPEQWQKNDQDYHTWTEVSTLAEKSTPHRWHIYLMAQRQLPEVGDLKKTHTQKRNP